MLGKVLPSAKVIASLLGSGASFSRQERERDRAFSREVITRPALQSRPSLSRSILSPAFPLLCQGDLRPGIDKCDDRNYQVSGGTGDN